MLLHAGGRLWLKMKDLAEVVEIKQQPTTRNGLK